MLFEGNDALFELVDVVGDAEPGLVPGLFAERVGQPPFELVDAGAEAGGAVLGIEQVGLQGCPARGGSATSLSGCLCKRLPMNSGSPTF